MINTTRELTHNLRSVPTLFLAVKLTELFFEDHPWKTRIGYLDRS
jgi:hypothetical protein